MVDDPSRHGILVAAMHLDFYKVILVSGGIVIFISIDCQENFGLIFIDGVKVGNDQCLYQLIHEKPIPRFGTLMRQVCERVGLTQPWLEEKGQAKYRQMEEAGILVPADAPPSSMLQQVISMVILGKQPPSYLQTLIWLTVIEEHYNNEAVIRYFHKKGLEMPIFTPELKAALWILSGHQSPEAVNKAIE